MVVSSVCSHTVHVWNITVRLGHSLDWCSYSAVCEPWHCIVCHSIHPEDEVFALEWKKLLCTLIIDADLFLCVWLQWSASVRAERLEKDLHPVCFQSRRLCLWITLTSASTPLPRSEANMRTHVEILVSAWRRRWQLSDSVRHSVTQESNLRITLKLYWSLFIVSYELHTVSRHILVQGFFFLSHHLQLSWLSAEIYTQNNPSSSVILRALERLE